jgi:hypothetical protein
MAIRTKQQRPRCSRAKCAEAIGTFTAARKDRWYLPQHVRVGRLNTDESSAAFDSALTPPKTLAVNPAVGWLERASRGGPMLKIVSAVLLTFVSMLVPGTSRAADGGMCTTGFMMYVDNGNFETGTYQSWCPEGPMTAGVDTGARWSHSKQANAYLQTATPQWNGLTHTVRVIPPKDGCVSLTAWVRAMGRVDNGRIGVRLGASATVMAEHSFSASEDAYRQINLKFTGTIGEITQVTIYIGYYSAAEWSRLMVDDVEIGSSPTCD